MTTTTDALLKLKSLDRLPDPKRIKANRDRILSLLEEIAPALIELEAIADSIFPDFIENQDEQLALSGDLHDRIFADAWGQDWEQLNLAFTISGFISER